MTIAAILKTKGTDIISIGPDHSVGEAIALLAERRVGAVPVMEGERVVGIFSERDVISCLRDGDISALGKRVRDAMTAPALTVAPGDSVLAAMSLMTRRRIRHLPVIDGGRVVGIVSIGDLVKYRIDGVEREAEAMRTYIQSA